MALTHGRHSQFHYNCYPNNMHSCCRETAGNCIFSRDLSVIPEKLVKLTIQVYSLYVCISTFIMHISYF